MPEVLHRVLSSGLEIRESTEGDGRTIVGIAVPAGERAEVAPGVFERIMPGAFDGSSHVVLRSEHGTTIGPVEFREVDAGLEITGRISATQAGNDALTLVKDGVLDRLSVGFIPAENGTRIEEDGTLVRTKGRLVEVSLTGMPAYQGARVLALRDATAHDAGQPPTEEGHNMPEIQVADVAQDVLELRTQNEDLVRRIETLSHDRTPAAPVGAQFRSAGEWLKALVTNDPEANKLLNLRVYGGTTTADTAGRPAWVSDAIAFVAQNRVSLESFDQQPLPATGMTVEYLKLDSSTIQVQEQVAEGDTLAFGKIALTSAAAPVKTYGGYTSLSLQAIQRSPVSVLDLSYRAMVAQAALRSNAAFRAVLAASAPTEVERAAETIAGWEQGIIDAELALSQTGIGQPAEFVLVSLDVFKDMVALRDGAARLVTVQESGGPGSTSSGSVNTIGVRGTVLGLPIRVDPTLAADSCYVANSAAFTTYGNNSPTRLQDDDVTNLTTEASVYFMQAVAEPYAQSVIKVVAA